MRIGLNLLHMHEGIGGVWNYVENLINELGRRDRENRYVVFVTRHSRCFVPDKENFRKVLIPIDPLKNWQRILFENSILHYYILRYQLDCCHWFANVLSPFSFVPGLVTIHDLLPLQKPGSYARGKQFYLQIMLKITAVKASSILAISNTTAQDVVHTLKPRTDQLHVLPVIVHDHFKPAQAAAVKEFKIRYKLPDKFWLYVANFYPHKNHIRLIEAYSNLKRQENRPWPLVLRGESGPDTGKTEERVRAKINELGLEKDVLWLERLGCNEMPLLYSGAGGLVFPSLFEGGGIPVTEAMACGCPVAASDIAVVREFAADAALFFNGEDIDSICSAMACIQKDRDYRKKLISKGIIRAGFFSGNQVVEKLLRAYKETMQ